MKTLKKALPEIPGLQIEYNLPLKNYTSFRVGGPADIFLTPRTEKALLECLPLLKCSALPLFILGKGSNIIVGDGGFRGIVIYTGELNRVEIRGEKLSAQGGISLAALARKAYQSALSGLEFASGIPGSLGGAVYMNAGAYGSEMKDIITGAHLTDYSGKSIFLKNEELGLSYRKSILQESRLIVIRVELGLKPGDKREIGEHMQRINRQRREKQPLEWPSAGSTFKRPAGYYTGSLIEEAGLKGVRVGDAQVSEKHAGFIINLGKATARDICQLIEKIQQEIHGRYGIRLEVEPDFIGDFI